jgi:hypothetical protein
MRRRKRRQCRRRVRSKALASIASFHAVLKSDEASAAASLFGSAPVSFEQLTPGEAMHNKAVNADAQVRPAAMRRPVLGRRLLLRYMALKTPSAHEPSHVERQWVR